MCKDCGNMSCNELLHNGHMEKRSTKDIFNGHLEKRSKNVLSENGENRFLRDLHKVKLEKKTGGNVFNLEDENSILQVELSRLRLENAQLQEKNVLIARELAIKTRDCAKLLVALDKSHESLEASQAQLPYSRQHSNDAPHHKMPGDSYPGVGTSLEKSEGGSRENSPQEKQGSRSEDRLLARLERGGSRMEQIKRQLVVQRGAIVAALRLVAAGKTRQCLGDERGKDVAREELDRAIGNIQIMQTTLQGGAQCPMCEACFPPDTQQEDFEQHVMDHFAYDSDQETLHYYTTLDDHDTPM